MRFVRVVPGYVHFTSDQRYLASMTNTDWDRRFLELADHIAGWSKDPSRGVGAVIVGPNKQILATGYNGLPRGVDDRPERLERPAKYDLIVHAEMNAIQQVSGLEFYMSYAFYLVQAMHKGTVYRDMR